MIGRVEDQRASRCCCRCQLLLMVIPWKWTLLRCSVENRGRYQLFLLPSMLPARHHPIKAPSRRFVRSLTVQEANETSYDRGMRGSRNFLSLSFSPFHHGTIVFSDFSTFFLTLLIFTLSLFAL